MKSLSLRKLTAHVAFSVLPLTLLAGCSLSPAPLDKTAAALRWTRSWSSTYAEQAPVTRRIDLSEAMARAVLDNLDHKVEMLDAALKARDIESASIGMLPSLVAGAGYAGRNNYDASSSRSLSTGLEFLKRPPPRIAASGLRTSRCHGMSLILASLTFARSKPPIGS